MEPKINIEKKTKKIEVDNKQVGECIRLPAHTHTHTQTDRQPVNIMPAVPSIGNESVPKIIINDAINLFFKPISSLLISNHNSFRVLFGKIVSVYFI